MKNISKSKFLLQLKSFFTKSSTLFGIILSLIVLLIMLLFFIVEKNNNESINTVFDAVWYMIVTVTTVGYGDISPVTTIGRLLAITLLIAGVAIFGALSGKFASFLFERQQKREKGLLRMDKLKNHFIICGYKNNFDKILEGILIANPEIPTNKIVLLNSAPQSEIEKIKENEKFKLINFVAGDFTDEESLLKANIKNAERTLILADSSINYSKLETDSRSVLAVITIKNLNPKIYCVAEITDSKFEKHLQLAHCDEVILTTEYENNLLATASSGKGYSNIIKKLIGKDSNSGIEIKEIAEEFIGKTYREYVNSLKPYTETNLILIGLLLNTGNFYKRRKEAVREAQKNPNVKIIVENLVKVKTMKSNEPFFAPQPDFVIQKNTSAIFIKGETEKED